MTISTVQSASGSRGYPPVPTWAETSREDQGLRGITSHTLVEGEYAVFLDRVDAQGESVCEPDVVLRVSESDHNGHSEAWIRVSGIDSVIKLLRAARRLYASDPSKRVPTRYSTADAAINEELEALFGDRGWDRTEAAEAIGWTRARLVHRLNGHSGWTLGDLDEITRGLTKSRDESEELTNRLVLTGMAASAAEREAMADRRRSVVEDW